MLNLSFNQILVLAQHILETKSIIVNLLTVIDDTRDLCVCLSTTLIQIFVLFLAQ